MLSKLARSFKPSPTVSLDAKVKELQLNGIPIINLGIGEPDFDTPLFIRNSAVDAMNKGFTHYAPISGLNDLKSVIADKFHNENKIKYNNSEIIIGLGSKPLLFLAFLALINKGDEVVIPVPSWNTFSEQVKICGGKTVFIPMKPPFKLKSTDIKKYLTPKTKVLLLNSPSNPTGMMIEKKELMKIANLAEKHDFYIVADEIYERLVYDKNHVSIASLSDEIRQRTITVNGFSKAFAMTGWRIGYAGGPIDIIKAMVNLQSQTGSTAVSFIQIAGITALKNKGKSVSVMLSEFKKRRKYVLSELNKIKGITVINPEGSFYFFVSIKKLLNKRYKTSADWCRFLLEEQNVALVPGEAFYYPGYFRLSYAASIADLREGITRIKKFINV